MHLVPFESHLAADVTALYNEAVAPVPDCHPVAADRFASLEKLARRNLRDEALMAAQSDDGRPVGFVHIGIALPVKEEEEDWLPKGEPAAIRFLYHQAGHRQAGQALLDWAERWARERARPYLVAWHWLHRYPFYLPYCYLSEHMGHVRALFGVNGYREDLSELYLRWPDFTPPQPVKPDLDFRLVTEKADGSYGPRLRLRAMQGGRELGACLMDRGHWSAPNAAEWCFCDGLDVIDEFQGKRLGLFLLATGLQEMRKQGCRHAAITTNWTNYRAALMYTNLGFQHADRTYSFRKDLA